MTKLEVVFDIETNKPVPISLEEIVKSRALFQANSGGGKSYLLRKFLEKSHGKVQQIIIDPEGEFGTLREKYDYLLVSKGEGANIQLNINHAALLARRLLETGANAILDLYELNPFERIAYVKAFCDALINLPKNLWHSCLIIIDEIHTFAPENSKGNAGSLEAVAALASRGRKRGYALIGATQKLSKFHKDVAAELNTKFTGRCILDIDQKRAAAELGLQDYKSLRNLKYEFWAFGPAISGEPILVKSYEVETKHEDIGNTRITTIADQDKLAKMMEQFKDLPTEAANELKTKEDLQNKIKELTVRLQQSERQQPKPIDPQALQKAKQQGFDEGVRQTSKIYKDQLTKAETFYNRLKGRIEDIKKLADQIGLKALITDAVDFKVTQSLTEEPVLPKLPPTQSLQVRVQDNHLESTIRSQVDFVNGLGQCERQILIALIQQNGKATRQKISIVTCYSNSSGGFNNAISKLKSSGCIVVEGQDLIITDDGRRAVQGFNPIDDTTDAMLQRWFNKLEKCPAAILEHLSKTPHSFHQKTNVGEATGYSPTSGGFNNGISKLNSLGLIEKNSDGIFRLAQEFLY